MEEKSKLRFGFLYRQTAVHQRKKKILKITREKCQIIKKGWQFDSQFSLLETEDSEKRTSSKCRGKLTTTLTFHTQQYYHSRAKGKWRNYHWKIWENYNTRRKKKKPDLRGGLRSSKEWRWEEGCVSVWTDLCQHCPYKAMIVI